MGEKIAKLHDYTLSRVSEIIDSELSNREKFAKLCALMDTAHTYHGVHSMDFVNFKDIDRSEFETQNFVIPD